MYKLSKNVYNIDINTHANKYTEMYTFGKRSVAETIYKKLQDYNIKHVFGYSGGANLPLLDRFVPSKITAKYTSPPPIKFITNSNEYCSGMAALGYSKSMLSTSTELFPSPPGVVITTSGPGVTNMITPLLDAYSDNIPLIMISGQVKTKVLGTRAFQEAPAIELTKSCTKWNYQIKQPYEIITAIDAAVNIATSGRKGPVHLDIPMDILQQDVPNQEDLSKHKFISALDVPPEYKHYFKYSVKSKTDRSFNTENIQNIANKINTAQRPIILAGQGANSAPHLIKQLSQDGQIPVATTLHGVGCLDENDDLSLQMMGMHGYAPANMAIQQADVIIAIGSRFDDRTTGNLDHYAPYAKKNGIIHINIDKHEIDDVVESTYHVVGDATKVLKELVKYIHNPTNIHDSSNNAAIEPCYNATHRVKWIKDIADWKMKFPFSYIKPTDGKIKVQQVIESLNNYLQSQSNSYLQSKKQPFFTTGVGNHQMMTSQFITWNAPGNLLTSGSLGVMGAGLPYAIGAQLANPNSTVICVDGDGSFNMSFTDLVLIKKLNLPIKIFIMNDSRMQMVYAWQKLLYNKRYIGVDSTNPDYVQLANSFDINAIECSREEDLESSIKTIMEHDGPYLGNFKVIPDICKPFVLPGAPLDDMLLP